MSLRSAIKNLLHRKKQKELFQCAVELKHAEELTLGGKLEEALQEVEKLEKSSDLVKEEQIACKLLKSDILNEMGNHEDALTLAKQASEESKALGSQSQFVEAATRKANAFHRLGRYAEGLKAIEEGEQVLEKMPQLQPLESAEKRKLLLNRKGTLYIEKGEMDFAIKCFQDSLVLSRELGDKRGVASTLNNIGYSYHLKGELDLALENYQNSLEILQEIDYKLAISAALNNIGLTYHLKGELDLALQHFQKSLAVAETIAYMPLIAINLGGIGVIHYEQGEVDSASNYYGRSLAIHEELGNSLYTSEILFRLVILEMERGSAEIASDYLRKLKTIREREENKIISQRYHLSEALLLKDSDRIVEKARAQEIFKQVAEEPVVSLELTTFASLNLCELLLLELKTFGNEKILRELKTIYQMLLDIASLQKSYSLLAETYLLQSKLALLELDVKQAQKHLSEAEQIAGDKGLRRLAVKVSNEHDSLLDQSSKWNDLAKRNASIAERLELAQLEDTMAKMILGRSEEIPDVPEEPVMLLAMDEESGLTLYSKKFLPEGQLDEQIIGGFLTAINSFGRELFSTTGSLERIKHQDFTIMMKPQKPLMFCYVFKGQSYHALQKLDRFILALQNSQKTWNAIVNRSLKRDSSEVASIEQFVREIFVSYGRAHANPVL